MRACFSFCWDIAVLFHQPVSVLPCDTVCHCYNIFFLCLGPWVGRSVCLFEKRHVISFLFGRGCTQTGRSARGARHLYHEVSSCIGKGSVCFY
ncbi:hypothetical protein B0T18DRAFT_395254 [Schizothecium vesticola]|uniref:Secreted protein n=1 Tax=Schizothecium vesticola TaxID=314040 RepID=A0AA40KBL2_9PEZI|nr:hypothetical protein B0T18DRAFT_395254 [Schizothecium vesticola]